MLCYQVMARSFDVVLWAVEWLGFDGRRTQHGHDASTCASSQALSLIHYTGALSK